MNRSSTRLAQTLLALAALSLGVTACTGTTKAPATAPGSPTTTTAPSPASPAASQAGLSTSKVATTPTSASASASRPSPAVSPGACSAERNWVTGPVAGSLTMTPSPLYLTRVGRHACYDRVAFDINGPQAVGFTVQYVPVVRADGSGMPVPVAGRAALQVIVRAPMLGTDNQGHQPSVTVPQVGQSLVSPARLAGWSSLRAVAYAGSFEGQTTVAVGVRERLPFRVFVTGDGSYKHVVVDIAH
jgi:hypothetical protein